MNANEIVVYHYQTVAALYKVLPKVLQKVIQNNFTVFFWY
jgi:hypothetical protein